MRRHRIGPTLMRILVAGATGVVGSACVRQLVATPAVRHVVALVRRPWTSAPAGQALSVHVTDLRHPDADPTLFAVDAVICALGTTMRQAGSEAAFRVVDHDYPLALAQAAQRHGVPHFLLVSALGADPHSRVFYNRVKGETERDVRAVGLPSLTIVRPSLLLGPRREFRPLEAMMGAVGWAVPSRWKPVPADRVAAALVARALEARPGERVLENIELRATRAPSHPGTPAP